MPSALALRFQLPQSPQDSAFYLTLFPRLAAHECRFVLFCDLRGFRLDHQGEVEQNLAAKASRAEFSARIRALVLMSDQPSERQRAAFANFWSIPVEVHDDIPAATRAFLAFHDRLIG
ncbi:hypothetical protein EQ718_14465 (plasmid) [Paracoccus versutus]|uniref:hypothetical protein n=1 Tax=Paracoccus versutus TaxID=34007 RepID=UPI0011C06B15|nr:hypothetical protein [Paracoccus versutus]WEJ80118.1 hypothetical protein EQ718_14465 [Paracoccus versutus]